MGSASGGHAVGMEGRPHLPQDGADEVTATAGTGWWRAVRLVPNVAAVVVAIVLWPVGFYVAVPAGLATGFAVAWVVSLLRRRASTPSAAA